MWWIIWASCFVGGAATAIALLKRPRAAEHQAWGVQAAPPSGLEARAQ